MAQTPTSQPSWHWPTIMTVTGIAAAYSLYNLYVVSSRASNTLHRSNAVHQRRRRMPEVQAQMRDEPDSSMTFQQPTPDGQFPVENESSRPLEAAPEELSDVADAVETEADMEANSTPNHDVRGLLYYIAEENASRRAYIHRGIRCEGCGDCPILGIRYHCLNCPDFDLCATCEAHAIHPKNHIFAKIKIPLSLLSQPPKPHKLWYAGDPRKIHPSLDLAVKKQLCKTSGFDEAELDALYDQFTCIANVPWNGDPTKVSAAITRRAFNKTMSSDRWANRFAPNVLLDRMFAFYDTDGNSLIGFKEFVDGMEYLRGSNRFASLRRALQGFDMDGDTYVSRADFLRILRGKFEIQKQLIIDATEGLEVERTQGAMDVLRSSQPISSVFNGDDIPPGEERRPRGKNLDEYGDIEHVGAEPTVLDDTAPFHVPDRRPAHERLVTALDIFEDLLHGAERTDRSSVVDHGTNSADDLRLSQAVQLPETTNNEPFIPDLLWHIKEEALNTLLDPLFARQSREEERAQATCKARRRWRAAIDPFRDNARGASGDSLAANISEKPADSPASKVGIVPTDRESLEQRELEMTQAPLDVLLETSGYSIREEPSNLASQASTSGDSHRGPRTHKAKPSPLREVTSISDDQKHGKHTVEEDDERPSPEILKFWARLDVVEHEMNERGGPGRLSLAEVESIVVEEKLHEVRGLIKSWLEWCAL